LKAAAAAKEEISANGGNIGMKIEKFLISCIYFFAYLCILLSYLINYDIIRCES
jgi:hypothetical protein